MKILSTLIFSLIATISFSQNVNYVVEVVEYYAGAGTDDSVSLGPSEELTWKAWGKDNNTTNWTGGICEGDDADVYPAGHAFTNFTNIVLIEDSNSTATIFQFKMEAWEDDDITNAIGDPDRCTYNGGGGLIGDDNYINTIFEAFLFREASQCDWKTWSASSGDFRITLRYKWEYTGLTAVSPISACGTLSQLDAFGSGLWTGLPEDSVIFSDSLDPSSSMTGLAGNTYLLNWSQLPNCINDYGTQAVTVNILANPLPGLITNSNLCENGDLIFTASNGVSYEWATGTVGNIIDTTSNGLDTIFNLTSSDLPVYVTVTDANGCIATESWSSTLTPGPSVDLGNDTTICSGTTATLDAFSGLFSYSWNTGETASIIFPSAADEYIAEVTDLASGCSGYDTVNVSVFPPSLLFLGYDVEFCIGDTVILDAQSGFTSYQWSDGSTNQTDTIVGFGEVSVTIVDTNSCVLQDTINFSPVYTYYSLYSDTTIFLGNSVTLTGPNGVSYIWNNGLTTQDITMSPIEDTTYIVTALQENGCYDVADVNVLINEELNFFIPNLFTPNNDESNDLFLMYGNGVNEDNFNFTIYNRWGEIVFETTDVNTMLTEGWDGTFNEQQQPVGTYVWVMTGFQEDNDNTPLQFKGKNTGTILLKR